MASLSGAGWCTTRPTAFVTCCRAKRSRSISVSTRPRRAFTSATAAHSCAGAFAALRSLADRARRRRHRTDRRSERQGDGAHAADDRAGRGQRRRDSRAARAVPRLRRTAQRRALVNNADWLTELGAVEFMRDVGKHFTVNYMMAKESVKRALESGGHLLHRVLVHAAAGVRLPRAARSMHGARCRSAAAISGATSPPASS